MPGCRANKPRIPHEQFCDCYIYEVRRPDWDYAYCYGSGCLKRDLENGRGKHQGIGS
jgi:hypothetical protein